MPAGCSAPQINRDIFIPQVKHKLNTPEHHILHCPELDERREQHLTPDGPGHISTERACDIIN
jgi:hypothetical protein